MATQVSETPVMKHSLANYDHNHNVMLLFFSKVVQIYVLCHRTLGFDEASYAVTLASG